MKYSRTSSPSLKLATIGDSMISPICPVILFWGLAINPRIPASCLICSWLPLAPESAIMKMGLKPPCSIFNLSNITSPTSEVVRVQVSITLLYLSPLVITPLLYCFHIFSTSLRAFSIKTCFSGGITISSTPTVIPERVAYSKPSFFNASRKAEERDAPSSRYDWATKSATFALLARSLK